MSDLQGRTYSQNGREKFGPTEPCCSLVSKGQLCAGSAGRMHAGNSLVHGVAVVPEVGDHLLTLQDCQQGQLCSIVLLGEVGEASEAPVDQGSSVVGTGSLCLCGEPAKIRLQVVHSKQCIHSVNRTLLTSSVHVVQGGMVLFASSSSL